MSQRRIVSLALAGLALAGAALLVVLARGVEAVDQEIAALQEPPARVALVRDVEQPAFGPSDRVARTLLSAGDDIEFRRAIGLIEESRRVGDLHTPILELQAGAIAILQRLTDDPPERASQAATLIGALYIEAELLDSEAAIRYRQQAIEAYQNAVRLDPDNETAKLGLELALAGGSRGLGDEESEGEESGTVGAGRSEPGSGY